MIKPPYADPLEHPGVDGRAQLKTLTNLCDILTEEGQAWFAAERMPGSTARWRERVHGTNSAWIRHTDGVILVGHNDDGACEAIYFVASLDAYLLYHPSCSTTERAREYQFNTVERVLNHYQADYGGTDVIAFHAHTGARMPELDLP